MIMSFITCSQLQPVRWYHLINLQDEHHVPSNKCETKIMSSSPCAFERFKNKCKKCSISYGAHFHLTWTIMSSIWISMQIFLTKINWSSPYVIQVLCYSVCCLLWYFQRITKRFAWYCLDHRIPLSWSVSHAFFNLAVALRLIFSICLWYIWKKKVN